MHSSSPNQPVTACLKDHSSGELCPFGHSGTKTVTHTLKKMSVTMVAKVKELKQSYWWKGRENKKRQTRSIYRSANYSMYCMLNMDVNPYIESFKIHSLNWHYWIHKILWIKNNPLLFGLTVHWPVTWNNTFCSSCWTCRSISILPVTSTNKPYASPNQHASKSDSNSCCLWRRWETVHGGVKSIGHIPKGGCLFNPLCPPLLIKLTWRYIEITKLWANRKRVHR